MDVVCPKPKRMWWKGEERHTLSKTSLSFMLWATISCEMPVGGGGW